MYNGWVVSMSIWTELPMGSRTNRGLFIARLVKASMAAEPGGRAICLRTLFAPSRFDVSHEHVKSMCSR